MQKTGGSEFQLAEFARPLFDAAAAAAAAASAFTFTSPPAAAATSATSSSSSYDAGKLLDYVLRTNGLYTCGGGPRGRASGGAHYV